jgi:hypothetical protein
MLERACLRMFNLWVQMIKTMWTEEKIVSYSNDQGSNKLIAFQGDKIHSSFRLRIKPGSMLPKDKFVERNEALELLSAGKIDDESLYERLGDGNPQEKAKKIFIQNAVQSGQIMSPGFLDAAEILYSGIKQEVIEKLKKSGAPVEMVQSLMGMQPGMEDPNAMPPEMQGQIPLGQMPEVPQEAMPTELPMPIGA